MITWLLEEAEQPQAEASNVAMRILGVNFAGLISSSMVWFHLQSIITVGC